MLPEYLMDVHAGKCIKAGLGFCIETQNWLRRRENIRLCAAGRGLFVAFIAENRQPHGG
jgi:hypothetical protein